MGTDEVTAQSIAEAFNRGRGTTSVYCPKDQVVDLQRTLQALGIEAVPSLYQNSEVHGVLLVLSRIGAGVYESTIELEEREMALQQQIV